MISSDIVNKAEAILEKNNELMKCLVTGVCPLCGEKLIKQTFSKNDGKYICSTCVFIYNRKDSQPEGENSE